MPKELLEKVIKYPLEQIACRNPQIACNADHAGNILLGEINLNKKMETVLKFCLLSTDFIHVKAHPAIILAERSDLVRWYL
jgi:hypothetical protein